MTVGGTNAGSGLDAAKFNVNRTGARKTDSRFVLQDSNYKPMVERVIAGAAGTQATLIQPAALMLKLFHAFGVIHWGQSDADGAAIKTLQDFFNKKLGREEEEFLGMIEECGFFLEDIRSEIGQYAEGVEIGLPSAPAGWEDEDEGDEEGSM